MDLLIQTYFIPVVVILIVLVSESVKLFRHYRKRKIIATHTSETSTGDNS